MKKTKNKKKNAQKETTLFMWIWIVLYSTGLALDLMDAAFGEVLDIKATLIYVLYLIFFSLGYYFAKKGKAMAGIIELVTGCIIILNSFLLDNAFSIKGIIGILVVIHAIAYLYYHKKRILNTK